MSPKSCIDSNTNLPRGLKIIVVGGGLCGLAAALALRQQGHDISLFEQPGFSDKDSSIIQLTPNATGILSSLGIDARERGAIEIQKFRHLTPSLELKCEIDLAAASDQLKSPWLVINRTLLHTHLKEAATSSLGKGRPVKIFLSEAVTFVDSRTATIVLSDGSSRSADVLVAADGVHSMVRSAMLDDSFQVVEANMQVTECFIQRQKIFEDQETKIFTEKHSYLELYSVSDRSMTICSTPNDELLNITCIYPAPEAHVWGGDSSKNPGSRLHKIYSDFHPHITKLLTKVDPIELKTDILYDLRQLQKFRSARVALIGQAAHPIMPYLSQDIAQAIEDAVSLGTLLGAGVTTAELCNRLQLYNEARYNRASAVQQYVRHTGQDEASTKTLGDVKSTVSFSSFEGANTVLEYVFNYNEIHSSRRLLMKHLWSFQRYRRGQRQPLVFGPLVGPRQDGRGHSHTDSLQTSVVTKATITFKTSASLVQNLLPNDNYSIDGPPGTAAVASFSLEMMDKLAWLGGGGYDIFALYIHNVNYKQADGKMRTGTYCPIMIENLADPIITGREELGVPKMFSDIEISKDESSYAARVSWRGYEWARMRWKNLRKCNNTSITPDGSAKSEGLLVHKFIPATGDPEYCRSDADYAVLIPYQPELSRTLAKFSADPKDTQIIINSPDEQKLPTLWPVVTRLAEIPIFEVIEANVVQIQGIPDLSNAERLN
ncbi:hypothetical protein F5884DRAFT_663124 [Xylogone sp. PMI_703]|nr:hypothetical protein F5884DRAFT_663124 [Xylogone sp. PMI_703]